MDITLQGQTKPARAENNTVRGFAYGVWVKRPGGLPGSPGHDVGPGNLIEDNAQGVLLGDGDAVNTYAWADLHGNTIRNNSIGVNVTATAYSNGPDVDLYPAYATLWENAIVNNSQVGVLVRSWVALDVGAGAVKPPWAKVYDNNTIAGNPTGIRVQGSTMPTAGVYPAWANVSENNTVANNTYGVWIDGPTVDPNQGKFRLWWNDIRDNTQPQGGVYVDGDPTLQWGADRYFNATCNWWKHDSGPFDPSGPPPIGLPDWNPTGQGQPVSDYFYYRERPPIPSPRLKWLDGPALSGACLTE